MVEGRDEAAEDGKFLTLPWCNFSGTTDAPEEVEAISGVGKFGASLHLIEQYR